MKRFFNSLAVAALGLGGFKVQAQLVDAIDAIVHDSVITRVEVQKYTSTAFEALARQYRGQPDMLEKKLAEAESENLNMLVDRQLILQEFRTFNVPESIIESEVEREIDAEIKSRFGDRVTLIRTLHAEGFTLEKYKQQKRDQMIVAWLRQRNVTSEIIISPHKV